MTIDINQFWNLLTESQLVNVSQIQSLFTEFAGQSKTPKTVDALGKWLIEKKAISPYQQEILSAGHCGPFRYGNYTLVDRLSSSLFHNDFIGRHTKSGHPVLVQFVSGLNEQDLQVWKSIEPVVDQLSQIEHPNVTRVFEYVILADHRFVVSDKPAGTTLEKKLPRKARLPWKKACSILAQVAAGIQALHDQGQVHGAVSPKTIWLQKSGLAQLRPHPVPEPGLLKTSKGETETLHDFYAPECFENPTSATQASDIYGLGCVLIRSITGRPVFKADNAQQKQKLHQHEVPPSLAKYEIPEELEALIQKMLAKQPSDRPAIGEVTNLLSLLSGKAKEIQSLKSPTPPTLVAYQSMINQFIPGTEEVINLVPAIHEAEIESVDTGNIETSTPDRAAKIKAAAAAAEKRKKSKWMVPAAVVGSLVGLSAIIGLFAILANNQTVPVSNNDEPKKKDPLVENTNETLVKTDLPPHLQPTVIQTLIDDDRESLWETPTSGPPVSFDYLPVTPQLLFSFRPAEINELPEGMRLIKSLGPDFESQIKQFEAGSGLDLESIDQLVISLHTGDARAYDAYFIVSTSKPIPMSRMMQLWNRPELKRLENQQEILQSRDGKLAYYVIYEDEVTDEPDDDSNEADTESNDTGEPDSGGERETVQRFAFGSPRLVEEVAASAGASVLSGTMRNIADWTDRDRHLNLLFQRNALFNDQGQQLMGEAMKPLNRELNLMIPDDVRGGLVSLHLDEGSYFEIMLDKNFDLKASELKQTMVDEFRIRRDAITSFVANIPPNPYWDRVRLKYDNMISDFNRNLRWDVEAGEVVANCWLPPMAAHNLLAASELVVSFAGGSAAPTAPTANVPQSLAELLQTKRDLNIANPPDLNVLLAELETEIADDFVGLPFKFRIRLIGGDLEKEGITKNQRPSELVMQDKTLAEVLTAIMTKANPKKDITGPSDPECKLIWVVADDPDSPGEKAILVTTRAAAAEKSYELPAPFKSQ